MHRIPPKACQEPNLANNTQFENLIRSNQTSILINKTSSCLSRISRISDLQLMVLTLNKVSFWTLMKFILEADFIEHLRKRKTWVESIKTSKKKAGLYHKNYRHHNKISPVTRHTWVCWGVGCGVGMVLCVCVCARLFVRERERSYQ